MNIVRRLPAIICAAVGVLCLVLGSFAVGVGMLGSVPEAPSYAFFYIWPSTVGLLWLFGACALLAARRRRLRTWTETCFIAWGTFSVVALILAVPWTQVNQRFGLLIIPLLIVVDGYAFYRGWQLISPRTLAAPTGEADASRTERRHSP